MRWKLPRKKDESVLKSDFKLTYDKWSWDEWLDKVSNISEKRSSEEIKSTCEFLSNLVSNIDKVKVIIEIDGEEKNVCLDWKEKSLINSEKHRVGAIWNDRKKEIEEEKTLALEFIECHEGLAKKVDPDFEIDEKLQNLRKEIELSRIILLRREIAEEIYEHVQQLVRENFKLVKDELEKEIDIEKFDLLEEWVKLDKKVKKDFGFSNYISRKRDLVPLLSEIKDFNEYTSWQILDDYLIKLKEQHKLINKSEQVKTKILLEELDLNHRIQKLEKMLADKLRMEIQRKINDRLNKSKIIINESEINYFLNEEKEIQTSSYQNLIRDWDLESLRNEINQSEIITAVETIEKYKSELINVFISQKLGNKAFWEKGILKLDLKDWLGCLNYLNIPNYQEISEADAKVESAENFVKQLEEYLKKIEELIQKIEKTDNNTTWEELKSIDEEFNVKLFGKESRRKDQFIQRLYSTNQEVITNYLEKLEKAKNSYIEKEQIFVHRMNEKWENLEKDWDSLIKFEKGLEDPWGVVIWENFARCQEISNNFQLYKQAFVDLENDFRYTKKARDSYSLIDLKESEKMMWRWLELDDTDPIKFNVCQHNINRIKDEIELIKLVKLLTVEEFSEAVKDLDKITELYDKLNLQIFDSNSQEKVWGKEENKNKIGLVLSRLCPFREAYQKLSAKLSEDSDNVPKLEKIREELESWQSSFNNDAVKKNVAKNWAEKIEKRLGEIDNKITEINNRSEESGDDKDEEKEKTPDNSEKPNLTKKTKDERINDDETEQSQHKGKAQRSSPDDLKFRLKKREETTNPHPSFRKPQIIYFSLFAVITISLFLVAWRKWKILKILKYLFSYNKKRKLVFSPLFYLNCQYCDEPVEVWQEKNLIENCGGCGTVEK